MVYYVMNFWKNKDFFEFAFTAVLFTFLNADFDNFLVPIDFANVRQSVIVIESSLLFRFCEFISSVPETASPKFCLHVIVLQLIRSKSDPDVFFPPSMSDKINLETAVLFQQTQSSCHKIYSSCFDSLSWAFSILQIFVCITYIMFFTVFSLLAAPRANSGEFLRLDECLILTGKCSDSY